MEIYSLVGHSGTGKSHQAPIVARKHNIDYLIDDGLLIKGNQVLAGRSAKRENTRYGAIKRALFKDEEHARLVREKIAEIKPGRLMIIGTSRRMTEVIAENLGLDAPAQYLLIEEVSNPESIQTALAVRAKTNRHVIPLPTFAIKKDFPGYFIDPLRSFFSLPAATSSDIAVERSVVRPVFSTLGSFYIAEHVVNDLVEYIVSQFSGVQKIMHLEVENGNSRVILNIDISINILELADKRIDHLLLEIQKMVKDTVEYQTGFFLDQINVYARKIHLDGEMLKNPDSLKNLKKQLKS